ncbi:MAG: heparan-alpha-glucosaminide N-acetyltransferase [Candidatus Diapherotrites archaeon]
MILMAGRFWELDSARGIAIIMMVIFHFMWDLRYFRFIEFDIYAGFWGLFQLATAGLFLLLVGTVLAVNYNRYLDDFVINFLRRAAVIFSGGLLLTVVTLIIMPEIFIYFGILHLIGVSILLSIPFIRRMRLNFVLGLVLIILPMAINLKSLEIPFLGWLGLATPAAALDFFPAIPWFGAILIGISLGNFFYKGNKQRIELKNPESKVTDFLQFLGRKSLLIYFLHQLILFPLVFAAATLLG